MNKSLVRYSKFLSLVLRHKPETIGIQLDQNGWANVDEIIQGFNQQGRSISFDLLKEVVDTNDKERFSFNEDFTRIRANQGHSRSVDLNLQPVQPPEILFHGTATRFWESIAQHGLVKRNRQHVHLSKDEETARKVGMRHGKILILQIKSGLMHQQGHEFYLSENGVWLTDHVPVAFVSQEKAHKNPEERALNRSLTLLRELGFLNCIKSHPCARRLLAHGIKWWEVGVL